jgi:hypothetical protein
MIGRKKTQEYATFKAVGGDTIRVPLNRCPLSKTLDYRVVSDWCATVGDVVDVALGAAPALCAAGLLDSGDVGRLAAMLHQLRAYRYRPAPGAIEQAAESVPADRLSRVLRAWTFSLFGGGGLQPLFGVEAAYYLEAVAFGAHRDYPDDRRWRLHGRLERPERERRFMDDRQTKKTFTECLRGGVTALADVRDDLNVHLHGRTTVVTAGTEVRVVIWRCPLSGGTTDEVRFFVDKPEILAEAWPYCGIVVDEDGRPLGRDIEYFGRTSLVTGVLPWRWIVAHLHRSDASAGWVPVPKYEWEIGS